VRAPEAELDYANMELREWQRKEAAFERFWLTIIQRQKSKVLPFNKQE
jgi:hypothetical protein